MITINTIFFFILLLAASFILTNLIRYRNGRMRLRLIEYFATEVWVLFILLVYECFYGHKIKMETQIVFLIAFVPKVISKVRLYLYLNKIS